MLQTFYLRICDGVPVFYGIVYTSEQDTREVYGFFSLRATKPVPEGLPQLLLFPTAQWWILGSNTDADVSGYGVEYSYMCQIWPSQPLICWTWSCLPPVDVDVEVHDPPDWPSEVIPWDTLVYQLRESVFPLLVIFLAYSQLCNCEL